MAEGGNADDRNWSMWLRLLSHSVRDTAGSASADDATVLQAVKNLHQLCAKEEQNGDLVGRVYPHLVKIFNRCSASSTSQKTSTGLLLLAILQFFLDFDEAVLHDSDPSLHTFFRSCLSRQYADATVAAATLKFLNQNKAKLMIAHPGLLPQYFPLLLKVVAWGSSTLDKAIMDLLPALIGVSSFLPLFPALLDLPTLVLALENLQASSGAAPGTTSGSKKSPAPEALFALMDEAYTGSIIADSQDGAGHGSAKDETEALFADLLKDENEGLAERHWSFPGMAAALQALMGSTPSERVQHALALTPSLLRIYFTIALRDVNDSLLAALLPIVFLRADAMLPDPKFTLQARKLLLEFVLAAFQKSPHLVAVLKKPVMDRIGQPHTSTAKAVSMDTAASPILLGLSDVLDDRSGDWLGGQSGSFSGLLGWEAKEKSDSSRDVNLAECVTEFASYQRSGSEESQEDNYVEPKDLNNTLFSTVSIQVRHEGNMFESSSSTADSTQSKGLLGKGDAIGVVKNTRRREAKDVHLKPWSFSTKSPVLPLKGDGDNCERKFQLTKKSPSVAAKSRQYMIYSNPLANGRRLSAKVSKKRDSTGSLDKVSTKFKRMSTSPAFKSKSVEKKKIDASVQTATVAGSKSCLERTPTSKDGMDEIKAQKLTNRQEEVVDRVMMSSPMFGKKKIDREKTNGLLSSVDLSAAGRRARRLSQVLRSEQEILHQNQQYANELQQLQQQFSIKEDEVDRANSAGMLLRQVCANQAEELKAYEGAFSTLYNDMSNLREINHRQENELKLELNIKLSLQTEVSKLRERVDGLANDIKQTRTLNTALVERVQKYEQTITSCRLHINQKPMKKEVSPMFGKKKASHSPRTPPRLRSDLTTGMTKSARLSVTPVKEVENDYQQENKESSFKRTLEVTRNLQREPEQHDYALQSRCENEAFKHR